MSEEKKSYGYYSGNNNILQTLVDTSVDTVILMAKQSGPLLKWTLDGWIDFGDKTFWQWMFDGWIKEKIDLNEFFKSAGLKNKNNEYPEVRKQMGDKYLLSIPTSLSLKDFEKYNEALDIFMQRKIKMSLSGNFVMIEPRYELKELIKFKLQKRNCNYIKFNIGEGFENIITLDLKENPHSYIVGTTGSGKSVMTKVILTNLVTMYRPEELELYLCDLKMVELNLFRNVKHTKKFVYTVDHTTEVISELLEETKRRYDLFMEKEVTSIFEYNKLQGVKKLKYQVLYVEEIVMLLEDKNKSAMKILKQLIAISRASGCYVFLTTQRPDNTVIDNIVKANINNRIVLKCEDSKNSVVALDKEGAEKLKGNGHGYLKNGSNIKEFQGYFIKDDQVKEYIKKYMKEKTEIKEDKKEEIEKPKIINENNIEDLTFLDRL